MFADGRVHPKQDIKKQVGDEAGRIPGPVDLTIDLSQQQIEKNEHNFSKFFDAVGDIVVVTRPDGTMLHANAAAVRLLGYPIEELRGRHILDLHPPEQRTEAEAVLQEMLNGKRTDCPLPLKTRHGSILQVESRIWRGTWNGEDCVYGFSKDISAQESALRKFDKIFHSNPTPMVLSRASDRTIIDVNAAFLDALGYCHDEVIGHTSEALAIFLDPEAQRQYAEDLKRTGRVRNARLTIRTRTGRTIHGLFNGEAIETLGEAAFLTVMTDVTPLESAKHAIEQWNAFQREITGISHRLVNLPWQDVDRGITEALGRLGSFVHAHRAYLFLFRDDGMMDNTHEWCAQGIEPQIENLKNQRMDLFPWWMQRLRNGETIHIPRVKDLPPEASAERDILQTQDIESIIVVPLIRGSGTAGFMGFDSVNAERVWPSFVPLVLRVAANILAAVLERRQSDQLLHEHRVRLEQAVAERTRLAMAEAARARQTAETLARTVETLERTNQALLASEEQKAREGATMVRLQQQLNQSQQIAHLGSWEYHRGEDRLLWSDETYRIFGLDRSTFSESYEGFLSTVHPDDRSRVEAEYARSLAEPGYPYDLEHRMIRLDTGEVRVVHEKCLHERDADGRVVRSFGFVQDITDAVEREAHLRQAQRLEAIGRLTAGIAHEINNPVGFLMNNFAALQTDVELFRNLIVDYRSLREKVASDPALASDIAALEAKEREAKLDFILNDLDALFAESADGFERVTRILSGMRSFARHERHDVRELLNINEAVQTALVIARNEYKYHCKVALDFGKNLPLVACQSGKINQVFLNLVVNAAHAIAEQARDDKGVIAIRTFADDRNVCVEVRDDGPGIPAAIRDSIFDPFVTTKPCSKGTGLGLSISYDIIVNQHGGRLTVDSREGCGAAFRVCLPLSGAGTIPDRGIPDTRPAGDRTPVYNPPPARTPVEAHEDRQGERHATAQ